LLEHFLIDTASVSTRNFRFLLEIMGEERVVFGSDYCGGLGPLKKGLTAVEGQSNPGQVKLLTERNSRCLLGL
jgi:predicted TIM-barrel fold metal-dependent hydrolase